MIDRIELHDSRVAISAMANGVVLRFCPAYVHHWHRTPLGWRGEGRSQSAEIVIEGGSAIVQEGASEISGGWLEIGSNQYPSLILAPLEARATVRMRIELVGADPLILSAHAVAIRLFGDPQFVEELPVARAPA